MTSSNNQKSTVKATLSSNVQDLTLGGKAILTFTFSELVSGFTIDDVKVTNGVLTKLTQSTLSPMVYTAEFIGGTADRSGMSTVKLEGAYAAAGSKSTGTPSNTVTIRNREVDISTTTSLLRVAAVEEPTTVTQVPTVGFVANNSSALEGNTGTSTMNFTVQLSKLSTESVTVNYSTAFKAYGSAIAGVDYVPVTSSVTFAPGETSKVISVNIIGDVKYESQEDFYIDLTSAKGAVLVTEGAEGLRSTWAVGKIINDDVMPLPTVGFNTNNTSVIEGNTGTKMMNFIVNLSAGATEAVTVNYSTGLKAYGSAIAGVDYVPVTSSITFAPGETSKVISVGVIGDTLVETVEDFYVDLTSAKGANIVTNGAEGLRSTWAVGKIINDDVSLIPTVGFNTNNASVKEGNSGNANINFTVQLSKLSTESVTVNYSTAFKAYGSAIAGVDYVPVTSSVTFAPGETSKVISVGVIGDSIYESQEDFYVYLTSATKALIVTEGAEGLRSPWIRGKITNDDVISVVSVTPKGLVGTTSKDVIGGTAAADMIYGKGGADLITGFAGSDTFVFAAADAVKYIVDAAKVTDFKDKTDLIGLQNLTYSDLHFEQGTNAYSHDTVVYTSSNDILAVLIGVHPSALNASDFLLVA